MKQRLYGILAAALLPDPELLVLDEPTNGLDPAGIVEMRGLIRSFADDGMTVLVSSHLISEIEQICDYVVMIRAGRLVHQGSVANLRATQQRDLIAAPEHDADLEQLAKVLAAAGCTTTMQPAENTVRVETAGLSAADLNRLAARNGITLRQLAEQTQSLERAFFALTGTDDQPDCAPARRCSRSDQVTWAAFTSEWTKLKRRTLLLSTFLGLAIAASLFVILIFSQAPATGSGGGLPSLQQLARPNGLIVGVDRATMLLGIVAFGIAAAQTASEYSLGTLRQLLVRQPRRVTLLAGKMLGVITFLLLAFVFAAVVAFVVAVVMAHARHGSTSRLAGSLARA